MMTLTDNPYERNSVTAIYIQYALAWTLPDDEIEERIIDKTDSLVDGILPILKKEVSIKDFKRAASIPDEFLVELRKFMNDDIYPTFEDKRKAAYQYWYPIIRKNIQSEIV